MPDLRDSIAKSVGDLLSRGDFINYLALTQQRFLAKAMLETRSKLKIGSIDADFFNHLDSTQTAIASSVYYTNYRQSKNIRRLKSGEKTVEHTIRRSYRLHPGFGCQLPVSRNISFRIQWSVPETSRLISESWCTEFKARIGNDNFTIVDAKTDKHKKDDVERWELTFEKKVELERAMDITFSIKVLGNTDDPVDICIAREACLGFEISLSFEEGLLFDCAFLGAASPLVDHFNRGAVNYESNGVTFRTNDWVMPGEGVVVYYQFCNSKDYVPING